MSTDKTFHGSSRTVEISDILLQIEKVAEGSGDGDIICHVFSLEDAVVDATISDLSGILTIEK